MRRLGPLGLLAGCLHRFLVNLKRQHAGLYAGQEPELVDRYLGKKALGCFSQVKPSESAQKLASVCQEVFLLVERFGEHPEATRMLSYRMLHRVLHEHCEVKRAAESGPEEVVAPVTGPPPAAGFSLADFQISPAGLVLACPQRALHPVKPRKKHHYRHRRYDEKASRLAQRRSLQQTLEFRDRYRWRAGVEGAMSQYDRLTGVKRRRVRGLKAVRFCAILKAVGVNLFRATAVRRAKNQAALTGPGPKSRLAQLIFFVKEPMQAFGTAITNFFIPAVSCYPFQMKMAA